MSSLPSTSYKAITSWPEEDRPREKLAQYGAEKLTDAELVAILLRTGTREENAVEIARRILIEHGGLHQLGRMTVGALTRIKGIGPAKAVAIAAAFQIGLRFSEENISEKYPKVSSSNDVVEHFGAPLRLLNNEVFKVLLLNTNNMIYKDILISSGHLNASVVHPREVFKAAIDDMAAAIILMHNHPSGNPKPSDEDIKITKKIVESGHILGIPVLDHIIIADKNFTSFADAGLL